jgi:hypothetical protein
MKRAVLLAISILTVFGIARSASSQTVDPNRGERRAITNVSFGLWETEPPLDRLVADPAGGAAGNHHEMIPTIATIRVKPGDDGGVNFIISGGHVVAVYDDGTQPGDIDQISIEPNCPAGPITSPCSPVNAAGVPTAGGILSDADRRIYRGPTFTGRRDGVEVVRFSKPGTYLVICARKNHFIDDGMFGFVRVVPDL